MHSSGVLCGRNSCGHGGAERGCRRLSSAHDEVDPLHDTDQLTDDERSSATSRPSPHLGAQLLSQYELIIQYGLPRTASTLQAQTLCAIQLLLHPDEPVVCGFYSPVGHELRCLLESKARGVAKPSGPAHCFDVAKVHMQRSVTDHILREERTRIELNVTRYRAALFTTVEGGATEADAHAAAGIVASKVGMPVVYAQTTGRLAALGYHLALDYQPIFGLTAEMMSQLLEYLRFWTALRQCCGPQMSGDWYAQLKGLNTSEYTPHHARSSSAYPACEVYDIDSLEMAFVRTTIYQRFATLGCTSEERSRGPGALCAKRQSVATFIGSVGGQDSFADGTYCSSYSRSIQTNNSAVSVVEKLILEAHAAFSLGRTDDRH
jgi:hypothetical protein